MSFTPKSYEERLNTIIAEHKSVIEQSNSVDPRWVNGWYERFVNPVVTNRHIPLHWRYDFNPETNPYLLERLGVNAAMNSGAIELDGDVYLMVRVEGFDRKSFFALARSKNGVDGFRFIDKPIVMPETDDPDTNVYDMRMTAHEDGWIYGVFCSERKDKTTKDLSAATAQAGIARTRDLINWERLPDLKTPSAQQRNAVLHPEFVDGQYAFYTRPQDGFIEAGSGGGIGWGLSEKIDGAELKHEKIIDSRNYHTIKESKNGMGGLPIKTSEGWLHIAHGVRGCAAGLRYVLYAFLCDLDDPSKKIASPGGYIIAPLEEEFLGDVGNVTFANGNVQRDNGEVLIYYASADTRMHVARTNVDILLDYVKNTPEDPLRSYACVQQRRALIDQNLRYIEQKGDARLRKLLEE